VVATTGEMHEGVQTVIVRKKRPGRWAAVGICLVLFAMFIHTLFANPNFEWSVVGSYFFDPLVLSGVKLTLILTATGMGIGIALGIVLALMRLSANPIVSSVSWSYIWFFRGTPLLVQLIFWYNIAALYPRLSLGVPFGPHVASAQSNSLISPIFAAIVGLGLNEAAYFAEIVRGGILSVERGQMEAALTIGMTPLQAMRRIVLPQAMRVIIPPTGNSVIGMLKFSALASVISVGELLFNVQQVYTRTYETIPLLIVASLWYLAMSSALSVGQYYIERYFGRGQAVVSNQPGVLAQAGEWITARGSRRSEPMSDIG
jgi:polar amino acid transport system permease protein